MKKRRYTVLSQAKRRSLVKHYEAGMTWGALARKFKVSEGTVTNILKAHDVKKTRCVRASELGWGGRLIRWLAGCYA